MDYEEEQLRLRLMIARMETEMAIISGGRSETVSAFPASGLPLADLERIATDLRALLDIYAERAFHGCYAEVIER